MCLISSPPPPFAPEIPSTPGVLRTRPGFSSIATVAHMQKSPISLVTPQNVTTLTQNVVIAVKCNTDAKYNKVVETKCKPADNTLGDLYTKAEFNNVQNSLC